MGLQIFRCPRIGELEVPGHLRVLLFIPIRLLFFRFRSGAGEKGGIYPGRELIPSHKLQLIPPKATEASSYSIEAKCHTKDGRKKILGVRHGWMNVVA